MDSETAEFGFIANEFKCPQADFAFVCPYPNMIFNVSYTNNLKRPIIINQWWDESLQNRLHKILGKVLVKDLSLPREACWRIHFRTNLSISSAMSCVLLLCLETLVLWCVSTILWRLLGWYDLLN